MPFPLVKQIYKIEAHKLCQLTKFWYIKALLKETLNETKHLTFATKNFLRLITEDKAKTEEFK